MRCKRRIDPDGVGSVSLTAENVEDMWHVYNLIAVGDQVESSTYRKVGVVSIPVPGPVAGA